MHRSKPTCNEQAESGYCHRATNSSGSISAFNACVVNSSDYYPFGSAFPGRNYSSSEYRWGFQAQEAENEIAGNGNYSFFKYRISDNRLGRFFALDPLSPEYPWNSPYAFSENRVIDKIELEGLEQANPPIYWAPKQAQMQVESYQRLQKWFSQTVRFEFGEASVKAGIVAGGAVIRGKGIAYDRHGTTFFNYQATKFLNPEGKDDGDFSFLGGASLSANWAIDTKSETYEQSISKPTPLCASFRPMAGFSFYAGRQGYFGFGFGLGLDYGFSAIKFEYTQSFSLTSSDISRIDEIKKGLTGTYLFKISGKVENPTLGLVNIDNPNDVIDTGIKMIPVDKARTRFQSEGYYNAVND